MHAVFLYSIYSKNFFLFSEDECNDLKDQLIGLEQTLESEKERLNAQITQLRTEYQEKNDKLSAELTLTSKSIYLLTINKFFFQNLKHVYRFDFYIS